MHYVICYDIESDRLRTKVAKTLERNGCYRVQRSVFAAPVLEGKHLVRLRSELQRLWQRQATGAGDSIVMIPLREGDVEKVRIWGENKAITELGDFPLKIIL